jgi:hypothetical protein
VTLLKCNEEGCTEVFEVQGAVAPGATYLCRKHTQPVHFSKVSFQDDQFDEGLHQEVGENDEAEGGSDLHPDFQKLRKHMDGSEAFMFGFHIVKSRTNSKRRRVPDWAKDDARVRELLLKSFPYLHTNVTHRQRAGRWMRVIQLYFRMKKSSSETAAEMNESAHPIRKLVEAITLAAKGKKANYGGDRKSGVNQTPIGGANRDQIENP